MATPDGERIARVEEQMRASLRRHDEHERRDAAMVTEIGSLVKVSEQHSVHIGLLIRCMYGLVGMILLAVGGAVMKLVVR